MAIQETGIWEQAEADDAHIFSYRVAKFIRQFLNKNDTVIDMGCGRGEYLHYLKDMGFTDLIGIEGFALNNFEFDNIVIQDLTKPFTLNKWGNVICIEVFEHIPPQYEAQFVKNIVNHCTGKLIISVAVPGQDGLGHVNCKTNEEVIQIFEGHGFTFDKSATDKIRVLPENFVSYLKNTLLIFERR